MILTSEVITALIGVSSALAVILLKDVVLHALNDRYTRRRVLLQARLERAYVPLAYLSFMLLRAEDESQQTQLLRNIGNVLQQHGHLLSETSLAAFYTLIDNIGLGAALLQTTFTPEYARLKREYYQLHHTASWEPEPVSSLTSNISDDISIEGRFPPVPTH